MPSLQGSSRKVVGFIVVAAVVLLSASVRGDIVITGSTTPVYGGMGPDPWVVAGDLLIESAINFSGMEVSDGSDVAVGGMTIVGSPDVLGSTTDVYLMGSGSTWATDELLVGPHTEGRFFVEDGGALTSGLAQIGGRLVFDGSGEVVTDIINGTGAVTVSGASQWDNAWLLVGVSGGADEVLGGGYLEINGGATVNTAGEEDSSALVGVAPDGVGEVVVDGATTTWSIDSALAVGIWGEGDLMISGGAHVNSLTGYVGGADVALLDLHPEDVLQAFGNADGTGTATVTGLGSQWNVGEQLVVGAWGTGDLTIADQGEVTVPKMYIGGMPITLGVEQPFSRDLLADGTGTVTVTGAGSLEVPGDATLFVGYFGTGTLNVEADGDVTAESVVVGGAPDADGTVVVSGAGSTLTADNIEVGFWGTGRMTISAGGDVLTNYLSIGGGDAGAVTDLPQAVLDDFGEAVGTGTVTVTGEGSSLEVVGDDTLVVGAGGTGTLMVEAGGDVTSAEAFIGGYLEFTDDGEGGETMEIHDGTGTAAVTGDESTWHSDVLVVGAGGTGTLNVEADGEVSSYLAILGFGPESTGTATVDAATWTNLADPAADGNDPHYGTMIVGGWGQGDLTVQAGGRVDAVKLYIGGFDTAELDGPSAGEGEDLGLGVPAGPGTVTVTGGDSVLDVLGGNTVYVGYSGEGTLEILDGGRVNSHAGIVGVLDSGHGLVTVDGTDSLWQITGGATAPSLSAEGEGEVIIRNGGQIVVDGTNGVLDVAGNITVGSQGTGSEMTISDGADVYSWRGIIGGYDPEFDTLVEYFDEDTVLSEGTGTVTITGNGSRWDTQNMVVGFAGQGTLNIANGGWVDDSSGFVGMTPGATGHAELTTGSMWTNTGDLVVGAWGTGTLDILSGSEVYALDAYIGGMPIEVLNLEQSQYDPDQIPTGTGVVNVDGPGSALHITAWDSLFVGYYGDGTLNVTNGGSVDSDVAGIGAMPGSTGSATIDGVYSGEGDLPSEWHNMGPMYVGGEGAGSMTVSNGGRVTVDGPFSIGGYNHIDFGPEMPFVPTGPGDVTVTGTGSLLEAGTMFSVGYNGDGTLRVEDGGHVASTGPNGSYIGVFAEGTGAGSATVTGNGSQWTEVGRLYVGLNGQGDLLVDDGGQMFSNEGFIGYYPGSTGAVEVTGLYSNWEVAQNLYVGGGVEGAGGTGTLMVNNGGDVLVGGELIIWDTGTVGGDGTISVAEATTVHNYGTIAPGNGGIGTLDIYGNVVFHEGSTYAVEIANDNTSDRLQVGGGVDIEGGTVQVSSQGTIIGEHDYEIINAYFVTGEFDILNTALLHFTVVDANLTYNESSVWLHLTAANFNDPNLARTYNQRQVAGALQEIAGEDADNPITDGLQDLPLPEDVRNAYDDLSGQTRPPLGSLTAAGTGRFLGTVTSRMQTVQTGLVDSFTHPGLLAMAGPDATLDGGRTIDVSPQGQTLGVGNGSSVLGNMRWGLWGRAYGLYGDRETEFEAPGYNYTMFGASVGLDYQFSDVWLGGLVVGTADGDVDFARARDNTEFEAKYVGLYGSAAWKKWYVDSVATLARLQYDTERFVDVLGERLTGSFSGYELAAYMEVGRKWQVAPNLLLQPLASVQYSYLNLDDYAEGGGVSALSFDTQTQESVKGSLGARLTRTLIETMGDFRASVQLRGRWVHEFGDDRASVDTFFTSNPAAVFTVRDAEIDRDSAVAGVGLFGDLNAHTRVYLDYDTRFNSDESLHVIGASLQYRW